MKVEIACIVEGHSERVAVPNLVRRIAQDLDTTLDVKIAKPLRMQKKKLLKTGELEHAVQHMARKASSMGGVLNREVVRILKELSGRGDPQG
jgi:hypothetical protein